MEIKLPKEYMLIEDLRPKEMGMPKDATGYQMVNEGSNGLVFCFNVKKEQSMSFNVDEIIEYQHQMMQEYEGLIETNAGVTKAGNKYAYVIIKHPMTEKNGEFIGTEYTMNINVKLGEKMKLINTSFVEEGPTGMRDATVYALLSESGEVGSGFEGWQEDPYDKDYEYGFLMNMSEKREYDSMFPNHPLSEERKLLQYIIENN